MILVTYSLMKTKTVIIGGEITDKICVQDIDQEEFVSKFYIDDRTDFLNRCQKSQIIFNIVVKVQSH